MNVIKKKKSILILFISIALFLLSIGFLSLGSSNRETVVNASEAIFEAEIKETYALNEKVNFSSEVNVEYDGQKFLASDGVLSYPDGSSYLVADKQLSLDVAGKYLLKYFSQTEAGRITFIKEFTVNSALYSVTGNNGSTVTAVSHYNMEGDVSDLLDIDNDITVGKQDGLIVRLNNGSKFVYSKPIDLSDANDNGLTDIIKLDPRMHDTYVDEAGHTMLSPATASKLVVTLTDAYNPDVYIKMVMHSKGGGNLYFRGSTSTLTEKGIEWPYSGNFTDHTGVRNVIYYNGVKGLVWHADYGRAAANFNLSKRIVVKDSEGKNVNKWVANDKNCDGVTLSINYEEAKLYVSSTNSGTKAVTTELFADFLNSDIYDTSLYQRFTTGEAFVSVEYIDYDLAGSARFDVFSIGKDDAQFLMEGISYEDDLYGYVDTTAPIIDVDFNETEYGRIYAAVGDAVKIPAATATDINLCGGVSVSVYRGSDKARKHVNVADGKFTVSTEDLYYVEYTAKDYAGNVGTKTVIVQGVDVGDKKALDLDIVGLPTALTLGKPTVVPMPKISTLNNSDAIKLAVEIASEKQNLVLAEFSGLSEIESFDEELSFIPLFTGEYKIVYKCLDNGSDYYSDPIEFSLTCNASDDVYFEEQPFLQRYLMKSAKYSFEIPTAYKYVSGQKTKVDGTRAYISFDGGEFTEIADVWEVVVSGSQTAQLKIENGDAVLYSDVAEIVDVNYTNKRELIIQNYFTGDFSVDTVDENGEALRNLIFQSNVKEGTNKLSFINIVDLNEFNLEFAILDGLDNFDKLNVILTDPYNDKNQAVLTLYKEFGMTYFNVDGGKSYVVNKNFADPKWSVGYSDVTGLIYVSGITGGVAHDFGFTKDVAYLELELADVSGEAAVQITAVGNQPIMLGARDTQAPVGHVENPSGSFGLGMVVTVNPSKFYDVLSAISYKGGSLSVTCNGEYVTSVDGVILDGTNNDANRSYEIALNAYGDYEVLYEIKDGFNVRGSTISLFSVVDSVAPTISLNHGLKDGCIVKLDVKEKFDFEYTVKDDVTAKEKLTVYITVRNLKSNHIDVCADTAFVFAQEGEYEISVLCLDERGNYSRCSFTVVVGGNK